MMNRDNSKDRLVDMWEQQMAFMKLLQKERNFPEFPVDISSKPGQKFLREVTHLMLDELFEANQHLKNSKSHRVTQVPDVDRASYVEELADSFHYFIELLISSGVSLDEFYDSYMKKGEINIKRIKNGY